MRKHDNTEVNMSHLVHKTSDVVWANAWSSASMLEWANNDCNLELQDIRLGPINTHEN